MPASTDSADEVCAEGDEEDPDEACVVASDCDPAECVGLADEELEADAGSSMIAKAARAVRDCAAKGVCRGSEASCSRRAVAFRAGVREP